MDCQARVLVIHGGSFGRGFHVRLWCGRRYLRVLLNLTEELLVDAPPGAVWRLLRDTRRIAGLLPGVENVTMLDEQPEEAYAAKVSDKIGPFKVALNLELRVTEAREPTLLTASLKGIDSGGANRVSGTLKIALNGASGGTQMNFDASLEILGKLATLGAVPIRRRTAQHFAEFARRVQEQSVKDGHEAGL